MPRPTPAPSPAASPAPGPTAAACRPGSLAGELRVALTIAVRRMRWERSSEGITDGQYAVLATLSRLGPMTPGALAEDQHVQPSPMTRTVTALEQAGLVRRTPHPTDRRQVLVEVTEAGDAEVRETRRRRTEWLAQRLSGLSGEDRAVLARAAVILRGMAQE